MKRYLNILFLLLTIATVACQEQAHEHVEAVETTYTCPMHPQIVQQEPGSCPVCGMDLVTISQSGQNEGELMLSESQMALGNIAVQQVTLSSVGNNTILTGRLVIDETQTDIISSRAAGRIERLYLKETGLKVQKGQPLYELYSEELLTLQREYLLALTQHQELGAENPRFASFLEAAKQKLLLYGLTEAQIRSLANSKKLDARVTFVASSSGVVTEVAAAEGQYVAEGSMLYRLSELDKIWLEAELYPQEVNNATIGDTIHVAIQGFMQEPLTATVTFISPEFRAGSQVALLRAELPNPDGQLLPGMQASVTIGGTSGSTTVTVPTDAVIRDAEGNHVWVQTGDHTFKARMVTLGEESAEQVAVLSGLQQNDKVVTSGAYLLYSEYVLKKGAEPMASHQH
ncbi:efflux RND transporter periplasmic adaptor subunit [Pontibacter harenae]|uniref:efflux RND transporter periplasmic adaptor subunit n=1 Tax=Pontibacter harenae TaxID=2894083 RepID=UPI001E591F72|nr:efflux RND transporter periplasmic adaptor subunit [Pontibacter harenae]MCC9167438.1 efflux RND transporter periplasmic adaptor subunit [Pontibacter harenae]